MSTEAFYDDYWLNRRRSSGKWDEARLEKVLGPLLRRKHVLDYGCGIGLTYRSLLIAAVGSYAGADVSNVALKTVRDAGLPAFQINPADSTIAAESGNFDGACCIEVCEHLMDPLAAARELFRVLKPGGVVVATVPNFGYHAWRLMALIRAQVPSEPENVKLNRFNGSHIRYFSTTTFRRLFSDAGFVNIRVGSFDEGTIWDITRAFGPFAAISDWARANLPAPLHLRFLQDVAPSVFAYRIRIVAEKPD